MSTAGKLAIVPLGLTLSAFLVITYLLCILYGLLIHVGGFHQTLLPLLLPGFDWLSAPGFFIGLAWVFVFGWYVAIVYAPLHNFIQARFGAGKPQQ